MIGANSVSFTGPIEVINSQNSVELGRFSVINEESVLSVEFSPSGGSLLAGISLGGQVKIWQVIADSENDNWPLLRILHDCEEENIDEFLTGAFLPNWTFVAAGKRKHRHLWDSHAEEAQNLPGILKIFDLKTGKCVQRLGFKDVAASTIPSANNSSSSSSSNKDGHIDEILYLKPVQTRKGNYILSCGQDGRMCRWTFTEDWNRLVQIDCIKLGNLAFHFDQMTEELVAVAVDNGLIIYDFQNLKHVRSFKTGFTSYCDFVKVVRRSEETKFRFILRGVELLKTDTHEPSAPNSIIITEIDLASASSAKIISRLRHALYNANSWLIKPTITGNGEYLAAPTITGKILIFNLQTGKLTAKFHTHDDSEVRQVAFHQNLPIMVSCGDDGRIRTYYQKFK